MAKQQPLTTSNHNLIEQVENRLNTSLVSLNSYSKQQLSQLIYHLDQIQSQVDWSWFDQTSTPYILLKSNQIARFNGAASDLLGETLTDKDSLTDLFDSKAYQKITDWLHQLIEPDPHNSLKITAKSNELIQLISEPILLSQYMARHDGYQLLSLRSIQIDVNPVIESFQLFSKGSSDACCLQRYQDGVFLDINDGFERITGYSREHLIGKSVEDGAMWRNPEQLVLIREKLREHGQCEEVEAHINHFDGRVLLVLITLTLLESDGEVFCISFIKDISEKLDAQLALAHSEEKYKRFFECAQVALGRSTTDNGKLIECNELFAQMMGFRDREECLEKYIASDHYVDRRDRERMLELMTRDGSAQNFEMQVKRKDGSVIWVSYSAKIYPEQGYMEGGAIDITERKKLEKNLERSEARWRSILSHAPVSIYVLDRDGIINYINRSLVGRKNNDILGHHVSSFAPGGDKKYMNQLVEKVLITGEEVSFSPVTKNVNGEVTYIQSNMAPIWIDGEIKELIISAVDITEQKKTELALQVAEQNWRSLLEYIPASVCQVDNDGTIKFLNHSLTGRPVDDLIGKSLYDYLPAKFRGDLQKRVENVIFTGRQEPYEFSINEPFTMHLQCNMGPIIVDGKNNGIIFIALDITRQKNTEKELRQAESKWQLLLENLPTSVYMIDKDGIIEFVNHSATGRNTEELMGQPLSYFATPHQKDLVDNTIYKIFNTGESFSIELETDPGGPLGARTLSCQYSPIMVEDNNSQIENIIVIANDITDAKKREQERIALAEQKRRAQKMEMIGTMAAGTAHSLNNYLTPILGFASMAKQEAEDGSMLEGDLEQIISAAQSAKNLVKQITEAGVIKEVDSQSISINKLIKKTLKLLATKVHDNTTIDSDIPNEDLNIFGDEDQLQIVILELATNALDSMQVKGGTLTISLEYTIVSESFLKHHKQIGATIKPGKFAKLVFKDTGHGMSDEVLDRIFEPFYTRKEVGKGTGLGLSMAQRVLMNHKGDLEFQSHVGKGTRCSVYLPLIDNTDAKEPLLDKNITNTRLVQ